MWAQPQGLGVNRGPWKTERTGNAEEAAGLSGLDPVDGSTGAVGNELPNQPRLDPTLAVLGVVPRVYFGGVGMSPIGASRSRHSLGAQGISPLQGGSWRQFSKETPEIPASWSSGGRAAPSLLPV